MSPKTQIFAETLTGVIKLEVEGSDTIDDVKTKIQEQHSLTFAGEPLKDGYTLEECGIHNESTLDLELPREAFKIFVKTPAGEKVEKSETIDDAKTKIEEQHSLTFAGEPLKDVYTRKECGIHNESTSDLELPREAMKIFLKTPAGDKVMLEVENSDTIDVVKAKVKDHLRLKFAGEQLEGDRTLVGCGIKKGSVLNVSFLIRETILIFVKSLTGKRISLELKYSDPVSRLKAEIQERFEIPAAQQRLVFAGRPLLSKYTLAHYGIQEDSIIELEVRPVEYIQFFVITVRGMLVDLEMKSSDTIMKVKAVLRRKEGNPPAQQVLVFAGNRLEDHRTLADYGVVNESRLSLNLRLRW